MGVSSKAEGPRYQKRQSEDNRKDNIQNNSNHENNKSTTNRQSQERHSKVRSQKKDWADSILVKITHRRVAVVGHSIDIMTLVCDVIMTSFFLFLILVV